MEFQYVTKPYQHQSQVFDQTKDLEGFALLWEMGLGKTKTTLDQFQYLYTQGRVDSLVILAPNGVHRNWITDELSVHIPEWMLKECKTFFWHNVKSNNKGYKMELQRLLHHDGPVVFAIPYPSVITQNCKKYLYKFMKARKVLYVADEAVHFKNPGAKRTRTILESAKYATHKRVLTGTPITNGPFDAYAIMKFLRMDFWKQYGLDSFTVFKQHFGVYRMEKVGKQKLPVCVAYRNLEELKNIIAEHADRRLKEEVLDLPPKVYTKRYFEMTSEQRELYDQVKDEYMAMVNGRLITAPLAITRLLRMQQIISGYIPVDDNEPEHLIGERNPRLGLLEEVIKEIPHQFIIWAKYRKDIDLIMPLLGGRAVRYDGKVDEDERAENKRLFQAGDTQGFVANPAVGAEGLTLVGAKTVVYYNNTYRLDQRLQSEDRAHRIGQDRAVSYIDLVCEDSVDVNIVNALVKKRDISNVILGDEFKDWL